MQKRYWWKESHITNNSSHFFWQPVSRQNQFEKLDVAKGKQILNHFEFHHELTTKINLIKNLQAYCEVNVY